MRKYIVLLFCLILCSLMSACRHEPDSCSNNTVSNMDSACVTVHDISAEIVSINGDDKEVTTDKFHKPFITNVVLFNVQGTNLYFKLAGDASSSTDICNGLSDTWVYNHRVGAVVTFKYLLKSRFFEIQQPNNN